MAPHLQSIQSSSLSAPLCRLKVPPFLNTPRLLAGASTSIRQASEEFSTSYSWRGGRIAPNNHIHVSPIDQCSGSFMRPNPAGEDEDTAEAPPAAGLAPTSTHFHSAQPTTVIRGSSPARSSTASRGATPGPSSTPYNRTDHALRPPRCGILNNAASRASSAPPSSNAFLRADATASTLVTPSRPPSRVRYVSIRGHL